MERLLTLLTLFLLLLDYYVIRPILFYYISCIVPIQPLGCNIAINVPYHLIQIKENKQLNTQRKQNYPDSVASHDIQPGNEVGLVYNGPEHHTGRAMSKMNQ